VLKQEYAFEATPFAHPHFEKKTIVAVPKKEVGKYVKYLVYVNKQNAPWADIHIQVYEVIKEIPLELALFIEAHTHEVVETYSLLGNLKIEVDIEGEKHVVSAPGSIIIPPGLKRTFRFIGGTGYLLGMHRIPEERAVTGWPPLE